MSRPVLLIAACLLTLAVFAQSQRQEDFRAHTAFADGDNAHPGLRELNDTRWTYWLTPDWPRFQPDQNQPIDWQGVLASPDRRPLNQQTTDLLEARLMGFHPPTGRDHFLRYLYAADATSLTATWNYNGDNPVPELARAALIVTWTAETTGSYTLTGTPQWRPLNDNVRRAWWAVGIQRQFGAFELHQAQELVSPVRLDDYQPLPPLQLEATLDAGDQIIFILAASALNYRGVQIDDRDLRIERQPPFPEPQQTVDALRLQSLLAQPLPTDWRHLQQVAVEKPTYWLYAPADANELLGGIVATFEYGNTAIVYHEDIGRPGHVGWFDIPESGYLTLMRDLHSMHWMSKLAVAYRETGDIRYRDAWVGYWDDFAVNWPDAYIATLRNPEKMAMVPRNSIAWCDKTLYVAWRLGVFLDGFTIIANAGGAEALVTQPAFQRTLTHMATFEASRGMRQLQRPGGAPNQRIHLGISMFRLGAMFPQFKEAAIWREQALAEVMAGGGFLPDGTDMEQSLNYNQGLPATLTEFIEAAQLLPESARGDWLDRLKRMSRDRYYFMHASVQPDGRLPIIGKLNQPWRNYGTDSKWMPGLAGFKVVDSLDELPLSAAINERFYARRSFWQRLFGPEPQLPAFTSIYFPYGGYVVSRGGWEEESLYAFMKTSRAGHGHMREGGNGLSLFAYGHPLIVNSGGEMYSMNGNYNGYWHNTLCQNSILVDGYTQILHHGADVPAIYNEPIDARWHTGERFDYAEGFFRGGYGGWNYQHHGSASERTHEIELNRRETIEDVSHERRLIFLRQEKLWLVHDILHSQEEHLFTQSWNFPPSFQPADIETGDRMFTTGTSGKANVAFYQAGQQTLDYQTYYGVYEPDRILGWVGKLVDSEAWTFTPAVDLLAEWRGNGRQDLVTLIVPYPIRNPVASVRREQDQISLQLQDGTQVTYQFNAAEQTLRVRGDKREAGLIVSGDTAQVYHQAPGSPRRIVPIETPQTFRWAGDERPYPVYHP